MIFFEKLNISMAIWNHVENIAPRKDHMVTIHNSFFFSSGCVSQINIPKYKPQKEKIWIAPQLRRTNKKKKKIWQRKSLELFASLMNSTKRLQKNEHQSFSNFSKKIKEEGIFSEPFYKVINIQPRQMKITEQYPLWTLIQKSLTKY